MTTDMSEGELKDKIEEKSTLDTILSKEKIEMVTILLKMTEKQNIQQQQLLQKILKQSQPKQPNELERVRMFFDLFGKLTPQKPTLSMIYELLLKIAEKLEVKIEQ